jgi:putative endonuclease
MYYTYLARCSDNSIYTGYCVDLDARENKHNKGEGAKYTRSRRPIKIIYSEKYTTKSEAMKREIQIKGWTKAQKENLITSFSHV